MTYSFRLKEKNLKRNPPINEQKKRKRKGDRKKESQDSKQKTEESRQIPSRSKPQTPYEILGISPTASSQEIRRAYKLRALALHPDKNPGRDTTKLFQRLVAAYESLMIADN